ncbi:MAG: secretin N-terminal domain-containing protein [Pirellulales bacterium]
MKRFTWAILFSCLAVAGVALAQQADSPQSTRDSSNVRPRSRTSGAIARLQQRQELKAGRAVAFNFIIVEVNKAGKQKPSIDLSDAEKIPEQLRALEEKGEASVISRVRLSTLDQQPVGFQIGETRPMISGRAGGFGGRAVRPDDGRPSQYSYQMTNVGMKIGVTSRIEAGDAVIAEVDVELSRLEPMPKSGDAKADGDAIGSQRTTVVSSQSTLRIEKERGVVMSASQSAGDDESREMLILVTAHVEQSATASAEKAAAAPGEVLKVFSLQNASAADVTETLQKLFADRTLRIAPELRTNSLIVRGDAAQLNEIEALVLQLDRGE